MPFLTFFFNRVLACRNEKKTQAAVEEIKLETKNQKCRIYPA
jgi:hypothetical protein